MQVIANVNVSGWSDKYALQGFKAALYNNERAKTTIDKYVRTVECLSKFLEGRNITKELLIKYRDEMLEKYTVQTVNGILSAINAYLDYCGLEDLRMRLLKVQRQSFLEESKELSKVEYKRLLNTACYQKNHRLYTIILTLGSTGIRIGELCYITAEAVRSGRAKIHLKGKNRTVILNKGLRHKLGMYMKKQGVKTGCIFRTRGGRPVDRSNICHEMKRLSREAGVDSSKVFPHNLRHLFAREFYEVEKNLAHLADVLGHSRIETTRIYVAVSARVHEKILDKMRLII